MACFSPFTRYCLNHYYLHLAACIAYRDVSDEQSPPFAKAM